MTDWDSLSFIVPPHTRGFGVGGPLPVKSYLDRLVDYARAAEDIGVTGAFVYDFPVAMDPWLATVDVLACSTALEPIVAVRPHQEAPESVARRVADLAYRFGRPTHVNVVAGATRSSRASGDQGDEKAAKVAARARLAEFAGLLRADLDRREGDSRALVVTPSSSTPGVVPADAVLMMARPRETLAADIARVRSEQGVERVFLLVGLVVRPTDEAAWTVAAESYRPDRRQVVAGQLFVSQVVSSEHTASYALVERGEVHDERLWYGAPARGIDAPKLVGAPEPVRRWLRSCADLGVTDVIVDLAPDPAEYAHFGDVL
ncbi:LLM class flavin-dependent oxidoreductase [Actinokineospora auranticolor]|uniref:Alkanesulfonate monooxygenase SsuD/methylene tetrahydromethanopterin reductase-like flavin-dependent oxidoreductase (Luciferase family) n=1 Tax=Actinokineospora auranticolor TaxID=155976 RepID=A0A2S6H181_9PSEU|nr:LLM class flavin-dependent oxidoreductase [Actinokineospora auranticolor]PPK71191.1 alkanesulfonate monooxygenase SsuD/methylene tetrahydromethanopterin reductase-like flavin-dependent oxidoreductase (luciferase family) [Actinokineospora auranticolor]